MQGVIQAWLSMRCHVDHAQILDEDAKKRAVEKAIALEEGTREPRDSEEQPSTSSAEDAKVGIATSLLLCHTHCAEEGSGWAICA